MLMKSAIFFSFIISVSAFADNGKMNMSCSESCYSQCDKRLGEQLQDVKITKEAYNERLKMCMNKCEMNCQNMDNNS
jgi:hypothetical protein